MTSEPLILKCGSASRPSGQWSDDDYDVFEDGVKVGRIFKVPVAPQDRPWMWASGHDGQIARAAAARSKEAAAPERLPCPPFLRSALSSKKRVPTTPSASLGLMQFVETLTLSRTKTQVNPPAAVPEIAKAHAQAQPLVALGASFHFHGFFSCSAKDRLAPTKPNTKRCNGRCN